MYSQKHKIVFDYVFFESQFKIGLEYNVILIKFDRFSIRHILI